MLPAGNGIKGWILYDGDCSLCRNTMTAWKDTLGKHGFEITPLQTPWVAENISIGSEPLLGDIRLVLVDETQIKGVDVYRYIMKRIWWAYPFYLLSIMPVFGGAFERLYRKIADNRYRFFPRQNSST